MCRVSGLRYTRMFNALRLDTGLGVAAGAARIHAACERAHGSGTSRGVLEPLAVSEPWATATLPASVLPPDRAPLSLAGLSDVAIAKPPVHALTVLLQKAVCYTLHFALGGRMTA
jgi:hypothetical protein